LIINICNGVHVAKYLGIHVLAGKNVKIDLKADITVASIVLYLSVGSKEMK